MRRIIWRRGTGATNENHHGSLRAPVRSNERLDHSGGTGAAPVMAEAIRFSPVPRARLKLNGEVERVQPAVLNEFWSTVDSKASGIANRLAETRPRARESLTRRVQGAAYESVLLTRRWSGTSSAHPFLFGLKLVLVCSITTLSRLHMESRGIGQSHFRQQTSDAPSHAWSSALTSNVSRVHVTRRRVSIRICHAPRETVSARCTSATALRGSWRPTW